MNIPDYLVDMHTSGSYGGGRPSCQHRTCEICNKAEIVQCTRMLNFFVCMECEIKMMKRFKLIMDFQ